MKNRKRKTAGAQTGIISVLLKSFIILYAFSGDSLSLMLSGYSMKVPVVKYFFTVLSFLDGWGVETLFMAVGLTVVCYLVKDRQKAPWVSGLSAFFAVCTVFGISYLKTDSWDCIFLFRLQFVLAVFVGTGYYFAYKNCILFIGYLFEVKGNLLRKEPSNKVERFLFQEHPFAGPLLFILLLALPWLICFCPGTLQWDAHAQLMAFFGAQLARENAGSHPVILTEIMGGCIMLGRSLFHSDSVGMFFYTGMQFTAQSLTFAYASFVLRKLKVPVLFSWGALLYWCVFPLFPIWGYTMVKDTPFYIFVLLLIVTMIDIVRCGGDGDKWRRPAVFLVSVAGVVLSRNEGRHVVLVTLAAALLLYRKHWKTFLAGMTVCLLLIFLVDRVYMPLNGIQKGNKADMLSVPLQQTARYLREHFDEVTEEEAAILQEGFTESLDVIAAAYSPVCSDPVKDHFCKQPSPDYVKSYFRVWREQFAKHPDTYIQAFINHTYGYFYPDRHDYQYETANLTGVFFLGNSDHRHDEYVDLDVAISDDTGREILMHFFYLTEKMPVVSMLFSAGLYTYILLGGCAYLLAKGKRRAIFFLVPQLFLLLLRIFSPVNASMRYMLAIMVTLPVMAAWCYAAAHGEESEVAAFQKR